MIPLLKKIFDEDSVELKRLNKSVDAINLLEDKFARLTDDELRSKTVEYKEKLSNGDSIHSIKEEAFAVVREAAKRVLNMRHFDVQLLGGLVLVEGGIAEMQTGEGKTLVATLPSYLRALEGKGVHVITANEYLAERDFTQMGEVFKFLDLSVGLNISQIEEDEKRAAYQADITYGTGTEFGFDFLRDNMVTSIEEKIQRPHHFAIVDEVDSILIDEARTPLIIAGKTDIASELFYVTSEIVSEFVEGKQYEYFPETKQINLLDQGADELEAAFGLDNLYNAEHSELLHNVMQSLRAHVIMRKNVDYIVKDDKIILVDQFTGRTMEGRTFSDGLHQAIEAKEDVSVKEENRTQASVTIQNYFRLYTTLSGMTGSASPSKQEFYETYNIRVVVVPTNKPNVRNDMETLVFTTYDAKIRKIVEEVGKMNQAGRPVLIGTTSIEQSEKLSHFLSKKNIKHKVLNAKTVEDEAKIIAEAGKKKKVIIATNMAGRGTDIILDQAVKQLGGLHVIGTELHESARIDMQLKGRSGRQGDPGSSQFIISLEDDLFNVYDHELLEKWKKKIKTADDQLILSPNPQKFVKRVQETVESAHFSSRTHLLKLDDVLNEQRKIIYKIRDEIISSSKMDKYLINAVKNHVSHLLERYCPTTMPADEWPIDSLIEELTLLIGEPPFDSSLVQEDEGELVRQQTEAILIQHISKIESLNEDEQFHLQMRMFYLQSIDQSWVNHIEVMQQLKDGLDMRRYGQEDPYRLHSKEALEVFTEFMNELDTRLARHVRFFFN